MPAFQCKHPTCRGFVAKAGSYCEQHAEHGADQRRERDHYYDQHLRDPEAAKFYRSKAWADARSLKLATVPWCERCTVEWARHVHHIKPLRDCTQAERTDQANLLSVCPGCHNIIEAEATACSS